MREKKGFTLVELLAVIVILGLIITIAVAGIGSLLKNTREKTLRETAASIIRGMKRDLVIAGRLEVGDYEFTKDILDSGGKDSPLGGEYVYREEMSSCPTANKVGSSICKVNYKTCSSSATSFVRVTSDGGNGLRYSICLTAGEDETFVGMATENELLDEDSNIFLDSSSPESYYNPDTPTITGGSTKVYNRSNTTLTCKTTTQYETGVTLYYEFGYASSVANFTAGTITWLGSPSTATTLSISKTAYFGARYYTCRVYASNGTTSSDATITAGTSTVAFYNSRLFFDVSTNGGTISSGDQRLYISYGLPNVYTSRTSKATEGTIPIATKSGKTFMGWYTTATGGSKVIDASGAIQKSISSWTDSNGNWIRTSTTNSDTASKLYARFS